MEEHFITRGEDGGKLYLRRKMPAGAADLCPPVLLVHGSTLPGSVAFDLPLDGYSWMDHLARAGRDVWSLDIRGYGSSTVGEAILNSDSPIIVADTEQAIEDLSDAIDYICRERCSQKVDLIGWSWGATVCGVFASRSDRHVRSLALYAPQWLRNTPSPLVTEKTLSQASRIVDPERFLDRWYLGLAPAIQSIVTRAGWKQMLLNALATREGQPMSVPNGSIHDIARFWMAGRPLYQPESIAVSTMVVVGTDDKDTPPDIVQALYGRLGSSSKRIELLEGGTHFLLFEPVREAFFELIEEFLSTVDAGNGE
ncbi:alpha/beta hydrolase [Paraburkholderia unamae]|uniref:Alpha-beta hydrolase superfamily lysophospholipase n=1 Tax=Paraburkholderia unamae TaxID=219649 RepID=A0ABX5KQ99_9BURK|nr:alpha/beta fold hydrolase [Paraburkholderia unamae]PVX84831.1 alpha-beta hydrolase superfamily lysophospholipase [Paraburkholderia unamae]CAG9271775.1 Lysophospholipase, alpha-beta hydrolase superfamily [Paraburkholderia unamae]